MKTLLDYISLTLIRVLVLLLELLPDKYAAKLAYFYVKLVFLINSRFESVAKVNLALVFPEKTDEERDEIFEKSKLVLADNILGYARIPTLDLEKAKQMCDYEQAATMLTKAKETSGGTGALIPTIHFDAFEFFVQIHALCYRPAAILGRGSGMKRFDAWWNGRREHFGHQIFDRKGGYREIIKRLKDGQDVIILCDQNVKSNHAVFADFFGRKAATTKTLALAALRSGAPIVFGSPLQTTPGKFEMIAQIIPHPSEEQGTTEDKIRACTENLHRAFEKHILKRPEAWFWIHRRWKTRPEGENEDIYI